MAGSQLGLREPPVLDGGAATNSRFLERQRDAGSLIAGYDKRPDRAEVAADCAITTGSERC